MSEVNPLEAKKAIIEADRETVIRLTSTIMQITELCNLDEEKMYRRILTAKKSEYGRINGLINLLAAVTNWPADAGDGASVAMNQQLIAKQGTDLDILEDIRSFRGYHTFVADDLSVINGVEPDYENYSDYCAVFLDSYGLTNSRVAIDPTKWRLAEIRAKDKALKDLESMKQAIADHKALMGVSE